MKLSVDHAELGKNTYDIAFVCIGYERRSSHIIRAGFQARETVAFCFPENRIWSYESNCAIAAEASAVMEEPRDAEFQQAIAGWVRRAGNERNASIKILVDISSMTRRRMAMLLLALKQSAEDGYSPEVDFFYSPARFSEPGKGVSASLAAGPVTPAFRGQIRMSTLPLGAVIGLGYEPQRALGAFELLEPSRAWAFSPRSNDSRYGVALRSANAQLLELLGSEDVVGYPLMSGPDIYYALDSLVFSLSDRYRLVLIPMGPKIFALCCLLVGLAEGHERPAVWRVGEVRYSNPVDVEEDGNIVGLSVLFRP